MRNRSILAALVCSSLLGLSPLAADSTIQRGIDAFATRDDGKTFYDFAQSPIPAGFFCKGSKPFAGRVALKGLPLVSETPGELHGGDTIVERLDDATFNAKGTAVTRIQFRALSMMSIAPIKTGCGAFNFHVTLAGRQRVTAMSIHRTKEDGGTFVAPLSVNVRLSFVPVKPGRNKGRKLELTGTVTFPPKPHPWGLTTGAMTRQIGPVVVDTNGDLSPDAQLPGTSNFTPGWSPENSALGKPLIGGCCQVCHTSEGELHCYYPSNCYPMPCGPGEEPIR